MSNEDKPPGVRDIRSLRERLGMLNKGAASGPAAPQPSPSTDTSDAQQEGGESFDSVDASTETLDIAGGVLSSIATEKEDSQDEPAP